MSVEIEPETWHDVARKVFPQATDDECERLLWSCSPFPFASDAKLVESTMRKYWLRGGETVAGAVNASVRALDRAMAQRGGKSRRQAIADSRSIKRRARAGTGKA